MSVSTRKRTNFLCELKDIALEKKEINRELALRILTEGDDHLNELIEIAEIPRKRYFQNKVQIHILNNVKNGNCSEDCNYCAQRKSENAPEIHRYNMKSDDEILEEARGASRSGAFRYCLVTSGRAAGENNINRLLTIVRKIKKSFDMEVCLSAGILKDPHIAAALAASGLDRYNHNLNTSADHYSSICTTHNYSDRIDTLKNLSRAGVSLCSGIIAGLGEKPEDLVKVAFELKQLKVKSIPVNFFIPIPGHEVREQQKLSTEFCLRILSIIRLINPAAELRLAAGRELYPVKFQIEALRVANSLFVSGYLNVKGSTMDETVEMLNKGGFEPDIDNDRLERK